ncbi:MAG: dienelactone hydrolase family protein, partial [Pirellulaceae bacterium]
IPDGQPGHDSEVRVVLPNPLQGGHTSSGKIPALVVNGAGAYLFSGMVLSDEDIEPMLPYVEQGFAIIAYETDGCQPSFDRDPTVSDIAQMTRRYVASKAGLVNAQRALSYALEKFPEIDADQLYAIGHSSGAKQALLLAAHDERIRGCVGFAPACQMDFGSQMTVARIGGGDAAELSHEVNRSMPLVHAKNTKVPMLLVYSSSDQVTRPAEVLTYAKAVGKNAVAVPVKCGGHGSVPDAGFKFALSWLRSQTQSNAGSSVDPKLASLDEVDLETAVTEEPATAVSFQEVVTPPLPLPQSTGPKPVQMRGGLGSGSSTDGVQSNPYFSS